ncbi:MAG: hypothetical protein ACM3X1_04775 [Ignavibacteriales bacterium]
MPHLTLNVYEVGPLVGATSIFHTLYLPWVSPPLVFTVYTEHILRQHAGWSPRSQMHLKYLHYFGNESSDSILEAYGIITKDKVHSNILRSKQCTNCNESNKPDSRFCAKCRMVLTYDAYSETLEKQQEKESEMQKLREKQEQDMRLMREEMENKFQQILAKIDVATLK